MKTPDQLTETAAFLFGIERKELFGNSRVAKIVEARQALAWVLRQNNWSLEAIGDYLRRDHTTIIHALKVIERRSQHNARLAERMAVLTEQRTYATEEHIAALERRIVELEGHLAVCKGYKPE